MNTFDQALTVATQLSTAALRRHFNPSSIEWLCAAIPSMLNDYADF
ncbi:hypothetical protein [Rubritalea sp.]